MQPSTESITIDAAVKEAANVGIDNDIRPQWRKWIDRGYQPSNTTH